MDLYIKYYNAGSIQLFLVQLRHLIWFLVPGVESCQLCTGVHFFEENPGRQVNYIAPKIALSGWELEHIFSEEASTND